MRRPCVGHAAEIVQCDERDEGQVVLLRHDGVGLHEDDQAAEEEWWDDAVDEREDVGGAGAVAFVDIACGRKRRVYGHGQVVEVGVGEYVGRADIEQEIPDSGT